MTSLLCKKPIRASLILLFIIVLALIIGCTTTPNDATPPEEPTTPIEEDLPSEEEPIDEPEQDSQPPSGQLTVHFIDVGQGDAILIQTPEQNVLIDGGDRGNTVVNYLRSKGVTSLDLVMGTHPHADHNGVRGLGSG